MRYRKSVKIGGIRLTANKKSVSASFGVPGLRYTVNSKGRRTATVSAPGTGLSYQKSSSGKKRQPTGKRTVSESAGARAPKPVTAAPGLFAPKAEKRLYKLVQQTRSSGELDSRWFADLRQIADTAPRYRTAALTVAGITIVGQDPAAAIGPLQEIFAGGAAIERDAFLSKYFARSIQIMAARGVSAAVPFGRDLVAALLIQAHQHLDDHASASLVARQLGPSPFLLIQKAQYALMDGAVDSVLTMTDMITNRDDVDVLLLAIRGQALSKMGHYDAALEVFKEALRFPSRAIAARHRVRYERAVAHLAAGQKAKARVDLERILAEDSSYPNLQALLGECRT